MPEALWIAAAVDEAAPPLAEHGLMLRLLAYARGDAAPPPFVAAADAVAPATGQIYSFYSSVLGGPSAALFTRFFLCMVRGPAACAALFFCARLFTW